MEINEIRERGRTKQEMKVAKSGSVEGGRSWGRGAVRRTRTSVCGQGLVGKQE